MINLRNLTLRRGVNVLLNQVNWTIYAGQRIGIIGANGCGKTSLFSLLLQQLSADEGDLEFAKSVKIAYVQQESRAESMSALDYVLDGDSELRALQQQLAIAETAHDGNAIGSLHDKLSAIDAYSAQSRAAQLLDGLGFEHQEQMKAVSSFSGGWRVRLNLAKALMCRSDILLLDEPTNHLDLDAVIWLEQWLTKFTGTLLLISHDRDFLDSTVNHIAHISHKKLKLYAGNYSSFEKQHAAHLMLQQAAFDKQQKKLAHMRSFVDRFKAKATKARQAQSRLKAIERMEVISAVQTESEFQFEFTSPEHCPNPLLQIKQATIGYSDKIILQHLNLSIGPKDRIAILGPNGAGKSSFIKLLANELIAQTGAREEAAGLRIGYFAQHQVDHLHLSDSPLDHLRRLAPTRTELELRQYLGGFAFSGDRVMQAVQHFSGGEKSRLALALLIWQKPNLLLLDEPTNHLDLEMRNALSLALQDYAGAMILVSHDRFLVRSTTDQFMLAAEGELQFFDGDLDDYQQWLLEYRKQQREGQGQRACKLEQVSRKEERQQEAKQRQLRKPLLQAVKKLEDKLAALQQQQTEMDAILSDVSLYEVNNKDKLQKHLAAQALLKKDILRVEDEWLHACEERDQLL